MAKKSTGLRNLVYEDLAMLGGAVVLFIGLGFVSSYLKGRKEEAPLPPDDQGDEDEF